MHLRSPSPARARALGRLSTALALAALLLLGAPRARALTGAEFAAQTTITRDDYGVPHIEGPTDAHCAFGYAYAQCEDYFWQLEDSMIMALGRHAELNGESGLENDLINRSFEVVPRGKEDFGKLPEHIRGMVEGFVAGVNWYLEHHPEVKPRLLTEPWENWYMAAFERHSLLNFLLSGAPVGAGQNKRMLEEWRAHQGSNAWAVSGSRTKSGDAMLYANPHQPYFGFGQFIEAHLKSGEGMNVSGASFIGSFVISIGHNGSLGWSHTVNEPSYASAWVDTFDDPNDPLAYRYDGGWRKAVEWKDKAKVRTKEGMEEREYTFRKTHRGPVVHKQDDTHYVSLRIAQLFEGNRASHWLGMGKAKNLEEFQAAMSGMNLPMFNTIYADRDGHIWYVYNGTIPKRDPGYDWLRPVDGSTSKTEWGELYQLWELPQTLDPESGYVQNCNSTPFTTTDVGNPPAKEFPSYIARDLDDDKRRAQNARRLLRNARDLTFDDWKAIALDSTLYWPLTELARYDSILENVVKAEAPEVHAKARPLMDRLKAWDCKVALDSTAATLCVEWYQTMYDGFYPAEHFKPQYKEDWTARFQALIDASEKLSKTYGSDQVKWGDIYVIQRHSNVGFGSATDIMKIPFRDQAPSYPLVGAPGPLGNAFTVYYTPPLIGKKKRYAIVGNSFMGVYEFGKERVKAGSLLQFGQNSNPASPHFDDQARMLSKREFKPAYFYPEEVEAAAKAKYHPGEEGEFWWSGPKLVKK